jgi:hypothetical protein
MFRMSWIRLNRRFGAGLALAALLLQFALAFGHSHPLGVGAPGPTRSAVAASVQDNGAATPAAPDPAGDDDCAICAVISIAGTARAAEPPSLPLPVEFVLVRLTGADAAIVVERRSLPFRSRAPPIV